MFLVGAQGDRVYKQPTCTRSHRLVCCPRRRREWTCSQAEARLPPAALPGQRPQRRPAALAQCTPPSLAGAHCRRREQHIRPSSGLQDIGSLQCHNPHSSLNLPHGMAGSGWFTPQQCCHGCGLATGGHRAVHTDCTKLTEAVAQPAKGATSRLSTIAPMNELSIRQCE